LYYDEILPMVGFESFFATEDEFAFKPAGNKLGDLSLRVSGEGLWRVFTRSNRAPASRLHGADDAQTYG
jgi:hypothetical protein